MYNISLHIEYLLLHHDCVVVPGIGAFINVRQPAQYNDASGTWMPMTREVRFNGALNHDDGLLASSYARKNKVSFAEGRNLLRAEITGLRCKLDDDGEVTMGQLGILRQSEGALRFLPLHKAERMSEILGYLSAATKISASANAANGSRAGMESGETHAEKAIADMRLSTDSRFDTDRNYYIPVNKIFARVAACLMIIFAIAVSIIMPVSDRTKVDEASVLPTEKAIRETIKAVEKNSASPIESEKREIRAESARFHAIVATFTKQSDAEKYISLHEGSGYNLEVINTSTKSRVSAQSGNSREELQQAMRDSLFRSQFEGAWIWEGDSNE